MDGIFGNQYETYPFIAYSASHIFMVIFLVIGIVALYFFRAKLREFDKGIRLSFFVILFTLEAGYHFWLYSTNQWESSIALPLQLCSISLVLCLILHLTKSKMMFQFVYFLGVAGALMAVLTPELFLGFPHFRYFQFFITHIFIILTSFYFIFVLKYKPTVKGLVRSFIFLNICAALAYYANKLTGGNYMFLSYKPSNGSLLDYFGPYPWYILVLEAAAFIFFAVILLPFYALQQKARDNS
ncbi:TIGR02206 family membrane protein [Cytobacillus gottheilii]|uniref:YwaF family protein n=1 Tax=Cytobacillus gottheilii TaxID=859144 RepID=UPI003CEC05C0